jgi:hypothetical protein
VMPVLPLFGSGETKLQPVYVGDVAEAVARALATPAAEGKVYELGGPRVYTYKALVQLVLTQIGRKRLLLPFPYFAWEVLAGLPNRPLSRDQGLMKKDNMVSAQALTWSPSASNRRRSKRSCPLTWANVRATRPVDGRWRSCQRFHRCARASARISMSYGRGRRRQRSLLSDAMIRSRYLASPRWIRPIAHGQVYQKWSSHPCVLRQSSITVNSRHQLYPLQS